MKPTGRPGDYPAGFAVPSVPSYHSTTASKRGEAAELPQDTKQLLVRLGLQLTAEIYTQMTRELPRSLPVQLVCMHALLPRATSQAATPLTNKACLADKQGLANLAVISAPFGPLRACLYTAGGGCWVTSSAGSPPPPPLIGQNLPSPAPKSSRRSSHPP